MSNFKYHLMKSLRPYTVFIPQLQKSVLRVLIQVSVHYIESRKCSPQVLDVALNKLTYAGHTIPESFCELFSMILQIMYIFLRSPQGAIKDHELRQCLKELRFSNECIEDLSKVLFNYQATLSKSLSETKMDRRKVLNIQWRINISLNSSVSLATPTVVLHLKLVNGEYRTLELPVTMFKGLRYNIARLLDELHSVQSRAILKAF